MALAGAVSVNSTNWPGPESVTALRPEASPASVPAVRLIASTVPLVAASSASCSMNGTVAPRPGTEGADGTGGADTGSGGGRSGIFSRSPWVHAEPLARPRPAIAARSRIDMVICLLASSGTVDFELGDLSGRPPGVGGDGDPDEAL